MLHDLKFMTQYFLDSVLFIACINFANLIMKPIGRQPNGLRATSS